MNDALTPATADSLQPSPATQVSAYSYRTFGLSFASTIAFPELTASSPGPVDVEIIEAASEPLDPTTEELADGLCVRGAITQFEAEGVARYTIQAGRRILIERLPPTVTRTPADDTDLRLFALGSAMGALLYQRGIIPLHASAVATAQGTWAFTGASGAGKSTLASWLSRRHGLAHITDDVLAAHPDGKSFRFYPGPSRIKLWTDALDALGLSQDGLIRDYSRADKFQMRMQDTDTGPCAPLQGLVLLERCAENEPASLTALGGGEAFQVMSAALYRPTFALRILPRQALFADVMRLARQVPCYRYRRPSSLADMDTTLGPLLQQMCV